MLCPSQYRHNNSCIDQCISSCYIAYDWSVFAGCSSSYIVRLGIWDYRLSFVSGSLGTTAEFERNQRVRDIIQDMFHLGQFSIVQFISDLVGTSIRFFLVSVPHMVDIRCVFTVDMLSLVSLSGCFLK